MADAPSVSLELILVSGCNKVNTRKTHSIHFLTSLKDLKKLMKIIFMQQNRIQKAYLCSARREQKMRNYSYASAENWSAKFTAVVILDTTATD